jgi:formylglycine-generating enzyme required for sulfatase activity
VLYLPGADDLVPIEGGSFIMGEPNVKDSDRPAHEVEIAGFFLAPLPVTGRQFALYLHATGQPIRLNLSLTDQAARGIRWREAIDYCTWLSRTAGLESVYEDGQREQEGDVSEPPIVAHLARNGFRLPTEAEWEYAARGGVSSRGFRFAGSDYLSHVSDVTGDDAVGQRLPNELGIYDMSGGRAEWCSDWYAPDYYSNSTGQNPTGPTHGLSKVCRGGDVTGASESNHCTVYARGHVAQNLDRYESMNLGFRLVRSKTPVH